MKPSYPHISRTGSTVVIEARTMAEADAAAEAELGPGFTVTSVRRLRKGGLGGFFALELVELVATTDPASAERTADMASAEDLIRSLQRHEGDFAARLLDRMGAPDVDPDAVTIQQLFSTARAAGVPPDSLWEAAADWVPAAADAVHRSNGDAPGDTVTRPPVVAEPHAIARPAEAVPIPRPAEAAPIFEPVETTPNGPDDHAFLRRRPRSPESLGPLAEMPPPPLRFDDEQGGWTVDTSLGTAPTPAPIPAPTPTLTPTPTPAPTPDATETVAAPAPATWAAPAPLPPQAPTVAPAPVDDRGATPSALPTPAPDVALATAPVVPVPTVEATPPGAEERHAPDVAPATPAATVERTAPTGPTLAEMGWRIDVDTPEPVVGAVDLGPSLPAAPAAAPIIAIDALDALPEVSGPAVNAVPDAAPSAGGPGTLLPGRGDALPNLQVSVPAGDAAVDEEAIEASGADIAADIAAVEPTPAGTPRPDDDTVVPPSFTRGSAFRALGLDALRGSRRSSANLRPRTTADATRAADAALSAATDSLPGTVAAFASPPVRTGHDTPTADPQIATESLGHDPAAPADSDVDQAPAAVAEAEAAATPATTTAAFEADVPVTDALDDQPPVDAAPVDIAPVDIARHDHAPVDIARHDHAPVDIAPVDHPLAEAPAAAAAAIDVPAVLTLQSLVPDAPRLAQPASTAGGWSPQALFALGLPDRLVHTASALAPRDDAEWTAALMLALRPLFGPVPDGPMLLAGPLVDTLAEQLGATLIAPGEQSDARLAALVTDDPADVLATVGDRGVHLVVGGMWHELARVRPAVVSTAGPRFLLQAVTVAHAWGAPLGVMAGVTTVRLDAVTVAMEIRATLGLDLDDVPSTLHDALNPRPTGRHPEEPAG